MNINVEISYSDRSNLGISNCIKILAAKSNSTGSEFSVDKISAPPHKDERKHSFLVTSPCVEKQLSLVLNIFITLTATATIHQYLNRF